MNSLGGRRRCGGYGGAALIVNLVFYCIIFTMALTAQTFAAEATRILALGDSITAGFGLPPQEALPVKLEARLKADGFNVAIANGGVSGDTTAGGLARLQWAMSDHPRYVIVELGANDALRGLDPKQAYDNLDKILAQLQAAGVKAMLLGMLAPGNWGHDYSQDFDAIYPKLAAKYNVPRYPFLLDGVALDPKMNQGDGLHPNPAGVALIVSKLAPLIEHWLSG